MSRVNYVWNRARRLCFGPQTGALILLFVVLPLSSCLVGPNYKRPAVNTPSEFRGGPANSEEASLADLPWWDLFNDDHLKQLVKNALANNYDIGIAATRVEQAREVAAQARAQYFPAVNYTTHISGGKNQFLQSPDAGFSGVQGFLLGVASASWEADLWGRIRRLNEAAKADYLAATNVRRGVMLSVVSDVSSAYFQLLGLRRQLEISRQSAQSFGEMRTLFTQRMQGGVSSELPVSRASANEAVALAQIAELEREIALTENQIDILLGNNPGPIEVKRALLEDSVPPQVPTGLPSALLERRPDVLSAEQNIRAANAQIGVAAAAYFPQIGLTTFFGKLSTPLEEITSGRTNAWSSALNVTGPIFQGGRLKAQKRQLVAAWEQAKLQYQQTVLNAFADVSNALISREKYDIIRAEQSNAVASYVQAFRLASMRYDQGFSSYFEILEAQQLLFPAQQALAQTELNRRLVIVQLYKSLGGGWNLTDEQFKAASLPSRSGAANP